VGYNSHQRVSLDPAPSGSPNHLSRQTWPAKPSSPNLAHQTWQTWPPDSRFARIGDARVSDARVSDARVSDARVSDARVSDARVSDASIGDPRAGDLVSRPSDCCSSPPAGGSVMANCAINA
jgi:hypothetical protein